jgi:hypothetical protein
MYHHIFHIQNLQMHLQFPSILRVSCRGGWICEFKKGILQLLESCRLHLLFQNLCKPPPHLDSSDDLDNLVVCKRTGIEALNFKATRVSNLMLCKNREKLNLGDPWERISVSYTYVYVITIARAHRSNRSVLMILLVEIICRIARHVLPGRSNT